METHAFVELYTAKAVEYLIAVTYLLLFVPFWRYVQGDAMQAVPARAAAPVRRSWFEVPDGFSLHPGHAWAAARNGAVKVGLDDFAHHLVGPLTAVELPAPGTELRQGRPAFELVVGTTRVPVLAPVDGTVRAHNEAAATSPGALHEDPYGAGWLLDVEPRDPARDFKQLLKGDVARRYLEACAESIAHRFRPGLGLVAADGGAPVHGFARELQPESWETVAREALLTSDPGSM